MKSTLRSHLFRAALATGVLMSTISAQPHQPASVRRMDSAVNHKATIPAGLVGQPTQKASRQFNPALISKAPASTEPGLQGQLQRKAAQSFDGKLDAGSAVVNIHARPSFLELKETTGETRKASPMQSLTAGAKPNATFDPRAYLVYPAEGSRLSSVENFQWTAGYQAQDYGIWVGSCQDCTDIANQDLGMTQNDAVYLPVDGRIVFVTLFTQYAGNWYWVDYQFVAPNSLPVPAQFTSPANGATLGATQTFSWTPGAFVDEYYLWIGSCQDCNDLLSESEGLNLSRTVSLPTDGRTIYVSMFSYIGGLWYWYDYQFRAASPVYYTPRIYVTNNLDYAINVLVNGTVIGSVSANNTQYADVTVSSLSVSFQLNQPTLSGRALGDAMSGVFSTINAPSGNYSFTVGNLIGQQYYFEPLITNASSVALAIEVNGGLESENKCNCTAPAGSTNVATGYYKLFSNGNVRLFWSGTNYTGRYWYWGTDANGTVGSGGTLPNYVNSVGRAYFKVTTAP